jgi:DNA-binding response OmpR family regulator
MEQSASVLIIDDDERLNELLTEYLGSFGFSVRAATHPAEGLRVLRAAPPDLLVLDVMLPGIDGFAVCRQVREASGLPIIMLTARGGVDDRVAGLQCGADDYLPKPFDPRELVARMQAILRRGTQRENDAVCVGGLTIDRSTRGAVFNGAALMLTGAEFDVLDLLVRNRGRVLSRDRIIEAMHGVDWDAYDRSIDVLVSRVRQKLGDSAKRATLIRTVRGAGYSFAGDAGG